MTDCELISKALSGRLNFEVLDKIENSTLSILIRNNQLEPKVSFVFQEDRILMKITSDKIAIPEDAVGHINSFCNYINQTSPCAEFFTEKQSDSFDKMICAKRAILTNYKSNLELDLYKELYTLIDIFCDTIYTRMVFLYRRVSIVGSNVLKTQTSMYEKNIYCVNNGLKFIGFERPKTRVIKTPFGSECTVLIAINYGSNDETQLSGWTFYPVLVNIHDYVITIKVILCNNKAAMAIKDLGILQQLQEFIFYANSHLKRAKVLINPNNKNVEMESQLVTLGMIDMEIQAGFQDLFSYLIFQFQNIADSLHKIATGKFLGDEQLYKTNKKVLEFNEKTEYPQFYLEKYNNIPIECCYPSEYITKKYESNEFDQEIKIIENLKQIFEELYHLIINKDSMTIKYPYYEGLSLENTLKTKPKYAKYFKDFVVKATQSNIIIKKIRKNLHIGVKFKRPIAYLPNIPYYKYARISEDTHAKLNQSLEMCRLLSKIAIIGKETIKRVRINDFDDLDLNELKGELMGIKVKLQLADEHMTKVIQTQTHIKSDFIIWCIGYVFIEDQIYIITKSLNRITQAEIQRDYINLM
jgi:hypothetical protein